MHKSRSIIILLLIVISFIFIYATLQGVDLENRSLKIVRAAEETGLRVILSAEQTTTSWDARDSSKLRYELPMIFLHQEREDDGLFDR